MTEPGFHVERAHWPEDSDDLAAVRVTVFIREQGVPVEMEWDGLDDSAIHVIARNQNGEAIGTARLLPSGQIGRMAVLPLWRGRGVGRELLSFVLEAARAAGFRELFLNAQTSAREFYSREGFTATGDVFEEAGIPHIRMELTL